MILLLLLRSLLLTLIFNLVVLGNIVYPNNDNLVAVVQIFRHGERTPMIFNTGDPYESKIHWHGVNKGQLTQNGKRQQYVLGKYVRKRYADFIPETYDENFFIARSTPKTRCHMSTQCTLYGIFPATGRHAWLENQDWQPIPVYAVDPRILYSEPHDCRSYYQEFEKYLKSKEYLEVNQQYSEVFQYISNHTGDKINDTYKAFSFYDSILIEDAVGLSLPEWTKRVYPEPLGNMTAFNFRHIAPTVKLQRVFMGAFLNETIRFFDNVIHGKTSLKYLMYCAHDSNLIALLQIFGAFDTSNIPWFTSSMWIELRGNFGDYYVNIWFQNKDDFRGIPVKGCSSFACPFNTFKVNLQDVLFNVDDYEKECAYT